MKGVACIATIVGLSISCVHTSSTKRQQRFVTPETRLADLRRARVWAPTDVASLNLRKGPQGAGAFEPNAAVTCDYLDKKLGGRTPKFACLLDSNDELKVKYGMDNGEVYAEVAASRLFWALGFGAERVYPVRVLCRGCPPQVRGTDAATIERKMRGKDIETSGGSGWAWPELDLVDQSAGGAPRAQRDALKLLAVFIQHSDSKPEQQRLICADDRRNEIDGPCADVWMMVHDLGQTFGRANMFNRDHVSSVNFDGWSHESIWADPKVCVGNLTASYSGTLNSPVITEAGRKFLADLLNQLTDTQLRDLFDVARFPQRSTAAGMSPTTVEDWVGAFKHKREEIVQRTCPS